MQIALSRFKAYVQKGSKIHPDIRGVIFDAAARSNNPELLVSLKEIIETINFSEVCMTQSNLLIYALIIVL